MSLFQTRPSFRSVAARMLLLAALATSASFAQGGSFRYQDPIGDLLGTFFVQQDIVEVLAFADETSLRIFVEFNESITAADSGRNDALFGAIDLDVDRNSTTGTTPFDAQFGGTSGLGVDRWIGLSFTSTANSDVPVFDSSNQLVGNATALIDFDNNELSVEVPLALLGPDSDGEVNLSMIAGTFSETSDIAPNAGAITSLPNDEREFQERFRVSANWRKSSGEAGKARWATSSLEAGVMWFFGPDNWEVLVKVLDGCDINDHYWVFFAATTDVEFEINVEDLFTGTVKTYRNELGQAADAVTDTGAFATCPVI